MKTSPALRFLALLALAMLPTGARADAQNPHTVTVTGESEVQVTPDIVVITLGVQTSNKDVMVAKAENDRKVKAIIETVRKAGLAAKDVQTDYVHLQPTYEGNGTLTGYNVQRSVVATLRDMSRFEDLLTAVLKVGANFIHGVDFQTTQLRKHRDAARALAITAAREKAVALAGSLAQKVGKPLTIREDHAGWWSYYDRWWGTRYGHGMSQNVVQVAQDGGSAPEGPFAPGTIRVKASVTTTFELH
jgi:uncharacterized protein YggE